VVNKFDFSPVEHGAFSANKVSIESLDAKTRTESAGAETMQKKARTYWFYKNDEAVLSKTMPKNTAHFAAINPSWEIRFGGNDPGKSSDAFQDSVPDSRLENILFEDTPTEVDTNISLIAGHFADASLKKAVQNTKDIWSYFASRQDGERGILNFDGDCSWSAPIQDSFHITGSIVPHRLPFGSCENGAFAYKSNRTDAMGELLGTVENNIKKFFDVSKENVDGEPHLVFSAKNRQYIDTMLIRLTPLPRMKHAQNQPLRGINRISMIDTIVNKVQFEPYGDIVAKYSDGKTKLNDLLKYDMDISTYYMDIDLNDAEFPQRIVSPRVYSSAEGTLQSLQA
jgi:hypothetical protein